MELSDEQLAALIAIAEDYAYHCVHYDSHCCSGCDGQHSPWLHLNDCLLLKALRLLRDVNKLPEWAKGKPLNSKIVNLDCLQGLVNDEKGLSLLYRMQHEMTW